MALNQILDLSTTAANNLDFIGVGIQEGMFPDKVNDAMRALGKILADGVTRHVAKAAGSYTPAKTDHNQFWRCTGAVTLNLTAAATLTSGWCLWVGAAGGAVTVDPNGAELVDGAATIVIPDGMTALVVCTGTAFFTWGFPTTLALNSGPATFPATATGLNLYYETDSGIASIGPIAGGTTSIAFGTSTAGVYGVGMTLGSTGLVLVKSLILLGSASPTPTTEGALEWDTDDNHFVVGDGTASRKIGKAPTIQILSTPGAFVYTPTAGARFADFEAVGAGAGSGGINGTAAASGSTGGGGSGFYGRTGPIDITGAATFNGSIGAAGIAGTLSTNGGNGGDTSIVVSATTYTWGGGVGSTFLNAGANGRPIGGTGGVGTNVIGGSQQGGPSAYSQADLDADSGMGGGSPLGTGGISVRRFSAGVNNGAVGVGFGAGGGGALNVNTNSDQTGAAGTAGYMRVTEYY